MKEHRLLIKAIIVLALALLANVTSSDQLAAEAANEGAFACAACFTEENSCEGNEDYACGQACGTWAVGECNDYDPLEVSCQTSLVVSDYVVCWGAYGD